MSYTEPARGFGSTVGLAVLIVAGFVVDLVIGQAVEHAWAWAIAFVVVVGADWASVRAARRLRSIEVGDTELRVGEDAIPLAAIRSLEPMDQTERADLGVLGRQRGEGLPRGTSGVVLHLLDGGSVIVATRRPQELVAALGAPAARLEVRPAEPMDLARLPDVDARAESLYRVSGVDLPVIPFPLDALHAAAAVFVAGRPAVGFVQLDEVDGLAHVAELAVLPAHMRNGLGSALLNTACDWARAEGYRAITLTTYADVAWNAPFYAARGFAELSDLGPELAELRDWEVAVGLDAVGRRVAMVREL